SSRPLQCQSSHSAICWTTSPVQFPNSTVCGDRDPETILPLATYAKAWVAIPGVSEWVLSTIRQGYALQFARHPPRFLAQTESTVNAEVAHLLRAEIAKLQCKGAIEPVLPSLSESGFYSRYFLVTKKDGDYTPHSPFLRFAFDRRVYQYTVLPFCLSLAPRTFRKCLEELGTLGYKQIRVSQSCISTLQPWLAADWYQQGVNVGVILHRKVISTDASNSGWDCLFDGRPVFSL
ncbi:hypothetical protein F2P79_016307, partial [Pimephales promelas]